MILTHAAITCWGKCMPPAVLDNVALASFLDTSDEWIMTRTGIHERRVSHVPMTTLSQVASLFGDGAAAAVIQASEEPLGTTDIDLPPCNKSSLELVQDIIRRKGGSGDIPQNVARPA